jgi:hypothetical protein
VELDELAGERQPQARSLDLLAVAALLELFEDPLDVARGDPRPRVCDGDFDVAVFRAGGDVDSSPGGRELDRVREALGSQRLETAKPQHRRIPKSRAGVCGREAP